MKTLRSYRLRSNPKNPPARLLHQEVALRRGCRLVQFVIW
jgi:hypothetical protein